jgi:hypothetical protein
MRNLISRFQRCIGELQDFDPATVRDRSDPRIRSLEASIDHVLTVERNVICSRQPPGSIVHH